MKASHGENRAVFLDRDGTLVVERNYLKDPALLEIFPGVPEALKRLQDGGFKLFVVTNQSGIGRGYYTVEDMHRVNARLMAELERRLNELHAPLQERLRVYEARIADLEKALAAKGEENRGLIKAKIEMMRKQLAAERSRNHLEFN